MRKSKVDITRETILREIEIGNYPRDFALPSERNMADALGVSYMTLRKAIGQLVDEKYLERRPNVGTFVCSEIPEDKVKKILGIVVPAWAAPEILDLIMHLTEAAEKVNWQAKPIFARSWSDRAIQQLYDECNAIVSVSIQDVSEMPETLRKRFLSGSKPVVFCDKTEGLALDSIFNDHSCVVDVCEKMYELGHRRFIRVEQLEMVQHQHKVMHPGIDSSLKEFKRRHADIYLNMNSLLFEAPRFELAHRVIYRKLQQFDRKNLPFTALVCPLSFYLGVASGLTKLGVKIPEEVSVLCVGDCQEADFYLPRPAQVCTVLREKAFRAMELVLKYEQAPNEAGTRHIIGSVFIEGETIATANCAIHKKHSSLKLIQ